MKDFKIDIDTLVKESLAEAGLKTAAKINESYVAEPKQYKQVSEFVSQKTKDTHLAIYKNNVETLNAVSVELDSADRVNVSSKHSKYRSLKLDETLNLNAVWLHELYLSNCFDPHSVITMDSRSYIRLERDWGTFDDFQRDFAACAMSCGNGWAICGYNIFLRKYVNTFISNDSQDVMLGLYPVIVVDMHEHAYYRDYLGDKKSYLVAQMREFNWDVIEQRILKAEAIGEVLK
jgi:superoxide dismutase, Fe-Mn family